MPGIRHNTLKAIRDALVGDETLTALVPAAKIRTGSSPLPTEFPSITLDIDGAGGSYDDVFGGMLYVTLYSADKQPAATLSSIYDAVRNKLHRRCIDITDENVRFHEMEDVFGSRIIPEREIREDVFSLAMQLDYMSQNK